ncbi:MAG: hypothetical protein Unbinned7794contig1000_22 [Prokaryotic dsDNA virus sp.]|nr:MAG: hypothetical protein Unbinned7794contig1000_22 [Prokaryotic dsDNA virus sp.]|tara:strand:+ start:6926 stop:7165 length:240 start_codon:yes stop_codon:yes gene_type:complete
MSDSAVCSPSHYLDGDVEVIDAMVAMYGEQAVKDYCVINSFKYITRYKKKNGDQDLAKAVWYLRFSVGDDPRKDKEYGK